jgi:hypothetical protein
MAMDLTLNISWIPPYVSNLSFSNCTLAGEWAAVYWRSDTDLPLLAGVDLLRDGLSGWLESQNFSRPTDMDILQWITKDVRNATWDLGETMDEFAYGSCRYEVCPRIGWQGNSDLAGRGVGDYVFVYVQQKLTIVIDAHKLHLASSFRDIVLDSPLLETGHLDFRSHRNRS